jgi:hypothetical protein
VNQNKDSGELSKESRQANNDTKHFEASDVVCFFKAPQNKGYWKHSALSLSLVLVGYVPDHHGYNLTTARIAVARAHHGRYVF